MEITGIICEYNPLHLGHVKQLNYVRERFGADSGIVCLMSGNYVQRGAPAIIDKMHRAQAAVLCGADLVLEMPVCTSLSSAEGFAAGSVRILSQLCSHLCFGAENASIEPLLSIAQALLLPTFPELLHAQLDKGLSFPAARQAALESLGLPAHLLALPNNILAIEYCKAILAQNAPLVPVPISREGSYHAQVPDRENPSATAIRNQMLSHGSWEAYIPEDAKDIFSSATLHTCAAGERAILGRLRCMTDDEFEALPFGSEGLWRKFMHAARREATLEDVICAVKSKRYTRTRIDRMVMCAFLGITQEMMQTPAPYTRILAFNDRGREILQQAKKSGAFFNIGEVRSEPYQSLESRCGDLYGLFATGTPEAPNKEKQYRIFYQK